MFPKLKKILLTAILISFVSVGLLFSAPRPAKAQWTVFDPNLTAWEVIKNVAGKVKTSIVQSGITALLNAMQSFTQKLAYDTAVYIASGGSGQKPLFDGKSFGQYIGDTALSGTMTFITDFSDGTLGKYGFNVCAPSLSLIGKIKIGALGSIPGGALPAAPRCDWNQFTQAWDKFGSSIGSGEVLKNFGVMFEPGQNELSFAFEFNGKIIADTQEKLSTAIAERTSSGGWKDVKDIVTGKVRTPSDVIKDWNKDINIVEPSDQQQYIMESAKDALKEGAFAVLPTMLSTFTNTLLSQSLKRAMTGLFPGELFGEDAQGGVNNPSAGAVGLAVGRRVAEAVYSDLIKPKILTATNYDPLIEFTACPDKEDEEQINNCVIDDNFAAAIRLADQGTPVTVAQAIERGYLDGGKPLISSKDAKNERNDCYQSGYCYSNLVKLRKARILPAGWELAAELNSSGAPADLKTIISGFNKCDPATNARDDQNYKWCRMIDPNWVLRLPKTQCLAKVYGPTLASSAGNLRAETCADPASCLSQDESGNCTGGYGYCTAEKNIWRIAGDKCSEQFNSCLAYKARDNKQQNYLRNTVEFSACNAENVGCRPYSNNKKSGVWSTGPGDAVYFNKNAEKCDASAAGCTEFYSKESGLAYNLLPNPSYEKWQVRGNFEREITTAGLQISTDGTQSFDGQNAVNPTGNLLLANPAAIKLELNTPYTFSGYVKSSLGNATTPYRLAMFLYTSPATAAANQFNPANIISTCKIGADNGLEITGGAAVSYGRVSCAFLTPGRTLYARMLIGGNSWIDAVQLEEGVSATAFLSSGYGAVNSSFIKAAPKYLNCEAGSTDPQCANYAPTCQAQEVGCERYAPAGGGPSVSAIANVNDICPSACAGYETYKQDKTLFESEKFPNYFIPATARTCNAADAGCDEFTNLATEAKEYFGYIRQCVKLNDTQNPWDSFYTWEGSDTTGYQLRAHRLKIGAAQTAYGEAAGEVVPAVTDNNYAACTQAIFKLPISDPNYNPDCREFYNAAGKVSYRLLSKTIIATDDCADYRKTESTDSDCAAAGGDWNAGAEFCTFKGYKAESRACSPAANKCRAYAGAAASNLRIVFQDDFESGDSGWKSGAVSSEALSAGGHSYRVGAGAGISKGLTGQVSATQSYSISFWAKGNGGETAQIGLSDARHGTADPPADYLTITLKGDWQYYELGPINTKQAISFAPSLQIRLASGSGFYIDNIILKEAAQKLYLIKDSWKTPAECDETSQGLPLPQAMLGCKAYNNRINEAIYLKSFGSLCRDEAVGCAAFRDTKNSASDKNEIWNAICARNDFAGGGCQYNGQTVCTVAPQHAICRFTIKDGVMPAKSFRQSDYPSFADFEEDVSSDAPTSGYSVARDESTVEAPADETVYLVNDKKYACAERDAGCGVLGQPDIYSSAIPAQAEIQSVYYKNKPDNYSQILCTTEAEGCESWTSGKGVDYFKVPKQTCEYKEASGGETGGWYKSGKSEACYPGFIKNGGYGIWRNADAGYKGSVGACPSTQNTCTEFIDPLDTSGANKAGRPYYLLDNDKLKGLENDPSCAGKASLADGCVLFNKTNDVNLKWNAESTYKQAQEQKKLAAPVAPSAGSTTCTAATCFPGSPCTAGSYNADCSKDSDCVPAIPAANTTYYCENKKADSNIILKVIRDRECAEWLSCKSSYTATDPITQKTRPVCAELGLCNKAQVGAGGSSSCANFIAANPDSGKVLSADYYSKRDTTWAGKEYSGFSLGNKYPVTNVFFQKTGSGISEAVRMFGDASFSQGTGGPGAKYYDLAGRLLPDGNSGEKSTCRGYPEQDSPYPASVAQYDRNGRLLQVGAGFQNANLCENGKNCECDYTKLSYGTAAAKKYTEYGNRAVPSGICQGGSRENLPCVPGVTYEEDPKNSCGKPEEGGTCAKLQRQDDVIGFSGYCLERDQSTPINGDKTQKACLTWLPQDIAPGQRDIYNQFRTAGYVPPIGGGKYYCLQASGNYSDLATTLSMPSGYDNLILTEKEATLQKNNNLIDVTTVNTWGCNGICGIMHLTTTKYELASNITVANGVNWHKDVVSSFAKNFTGDIATTLFTPAAFGYPYPYYTADSPASGNPWSVSPKGPFQYKYYFKNPKLALSSDLSETKEIYKNDIDKIRVKVIASGSEDGTRHPNPGAVFYIDPTKAIKNYTFGILCDKDSANNCSGEEGAAGLRSMDQKARSVVDKSKPDGERWYFRYVYAPSGIQVSGDYLTTDLFTKQYTYPPDNNKNFPLLCEYLGSENRLSVFQLVFEFDKIGLLKDIGVVACTSNPSTDDSKNGFRLQLSARMRETCDTVADVASFKNMANTQNIWSENLKNKDEDASITGNYYHYNYEVQPFGSASQEAIPFDKRWYSYYTVGTHNFAGVPWACTDNCGTPLRSDSDNTTIDFDSKDNTSALSQKISNKTMSSIQFGSSLGNLFAKIFKYFTWSASEGKYVESNCNASPKPSGCYDDSSLGKVPLIYSFYPSVQLANRQYKLGQAGSIILNNLFSQDVSVEGSQYQAVVRFYAWAMSSQMPLKSIEVDWGDGSFTRTTDGLYKNHKPVCAKTNDENPKTCFSGLSPGDPGAKKSEIICSTNADCPLGTGSCGDSSGPYFGNSPGACEEGYFEFSHIYTCGNTPGTACNSWTPTVKVIDNWSKEASASYGGKITLTP